MSRSVALLPLMFLTTSVCLSAGTPISPGQVSGSPAVSSSCPTFSWAPEEGATGYELVVFELPESPADAGISSAEPVIRIDLPPGTSWTPNSEQCLARGARYAWSIRGLGKSSNWSDSLAFSVPASPSLEEALAAAATLRAFANGGAFPDGDAPAEVAVENSEPVDLVFPTEPAAFAPPPETRALTRALPADSMSVAGEYGYGSPKTYEVNLAASEFILDVTSEDEVVDWSGASLRILSGSSPYAIDLIGPVQLPQDAVIQSVACRYQDGTGTENLTLTGFFRRSSKTSTGSFVLSNISIVTNGSAFGVQTVDGDTAGLPHTVDNTMSDYYFNLGYSTTAVGGTASSLLRFWGCTVNYELDRVSH